MATLKDAEQAREQAAEQLRGLGAHAISVEEEPADGAEVDADRPDVDRSDTDRSPGSTAATGTVDDVEGPADALEGGPRRRRRRSFAVVAWFAEDPPADLPQALEVRGGTRKKVVPLRARRAEQFRAE